MDSRQVPGRYLFGVQSRPCLVIRSCTVGKWLVGVKLDDCGTMGGLASPVMPLTSTNMSLYLIPQLRWLQNFHCLPSWRSLEQGEPCLSSAWFSHPSIYLLSLLNPPCFHLKAAVVSAQTLLWSYSYSSSAGILVQQYPCTAIPACPLALVLCMIPHSALSSLPSRYVLALHTQALCGVGCSPGAVQSPSWVQEPGWTQEPLPHQPQSPYTPPQPPSTKLLAQGFIESLPAPCLCSRF